MAENTAPLVVNGWSIFAHPLFLDQLESVIARVERSKKKHPNKYLNKNPAKHLRAIRKLAFKVIPDNPTSRTYRQGKTLGDDYKDWSRAKFQQQYRLFFRYSTENKAIALAWVNDDDCLRAYGSKTDAYVVFGNMLDSGRPPSDWDELIKECRSATTRLEQIFQSVQPKLGT